MNIRRLSEAIDPVLARPRKRTAGVAFNTESAVCASAPSGPKQTSLSSSRV